VEKRLKSLFNIKIYILTILVIFGLLGSVGCGSKSNADGSGHVYEYDLSANPRTLDPQTAVAAHERMVISNIFEGLLRMDSDGNITNGVAAEYKVSKDLLTYTFYLRGDVFWRDKHDFTAPCTARDFVFAFRRLFNPEVKSQNAKDYFCIAKSGEVNAGEAKPSQLGVTAKDDYTLEITLEYPNPDFLVLMTMPPSFPCNEKFYIKSEGRYGLNEDSVPANGAFFLREWVYDPWWKDENRIILRRHEKNSESEQVFPYGVNFYLDRNAVNKDSTPLSLFKANDSNCIIMSNGAQALIKSGYPNVGTENSVWGIKFSESEIFADENFRLATAYACDMGAVEAFEDGKTGYRKTDMIIPDSVKIQGEFFRDIIKGSDGNAKITADSTKALSHFNKSAYIGESVSESPVLIIPRITGDDTIEKIITSLSQQWQAKLSLYCAVEILEMNDYTARLESGNYDMAVVKLSANYNSPSAVLEQIADFEMQSISDDKKEIAQFYLAKENEILQSGTFIPICFVTEYFFQSKKSSDLVYNPFTGVILFKDGKYK
jgi:oligopeptide transport system substrate-binding protein